MKILFIHPNFPAQFRHVAAALGANTSHEVVFATANPRPEWEIKGVKKDIYTPEEFDPPGNVFPPREFSNALNAGKAVLELLMSLKQRGFYPDVIYGHSGWGTTFFVKDVFPNARFICYFEWYYNIHGSNLDFDPENPPDINTATNIRFRNIYQLNDLQTCNFGISPTLWQKHQFPEIFRDKIITLHDGIDTNYFNPASSNITDIPGLKIPDNAKIITYAARGLEPYRGFPQFMEALAILLKKNDEFHAVIAGSDRICYGPPRKDGLNYREYMINKLKIPLDRVHFIGTLPYGQYVKLLQVSTVHTYLTYPFVLSWSFLEAMSCGCVVVASNTAPVNEVILDGKNGIIADFFSPEDIAAKINGVLTYPSYTKKMRENARKTIEENYSLKKLLPKHLEFIVGDRGQQATEVNGPFG